MNYFRRNLRPGLFAILQVSGAKGDRTLDLRNAIARFSTVVSQLFSSAASIQQQPFSNSIRNLFTRRLAASLSGVNTNNRDIVNDFTRHGDDVIAALYVETGGHYFGVEGVDPWDINRDARNYEGPHSVVAHPPCHLWVNFAALNFKRYGGEHNRPGNDGGCFGSALNSVRRWGGVLGHPAHSNAWRHFSLMAPKGIGWTRAGEREWVCEVWQSAYGHKARKRTWLYYVGDAAPPELDWSRKAGTAQCGWFDRIKPTLSKKEASRTPVAFRDLLIGLAQTAQRRAV